MEKAMILCESRHDIPMVQSKPIFPKIVDPTNLKALERIARESLYAGVHYTDKLEKLTVYVTGLTVATVTVINIALRDGIELVLRHYNSDTGGYYDQKIYRKDCA